MSVQFSSVTSLRAGLISYITASCNLPAASWQKRGAEGMSPFFSF